jgi:hypothetical protein
MLLQPLLLRLESSPLAYIYRNRKYQRDDSDSLASAIIGRVAGTSNIIYHRIVANFDDLCPLFEDRQCFSIDRRRDLVDAVDSGF